MDFGDILNAWEKRQTEKSGSEREDMEDLISRYPPKESKEEASLRVNPDRENARGASTRRASTRLIEPQAVLDLHGLNSREAEQSLDEFISRARRKGFRRVLIVHGKGNHSQSEPVLVGLVRRYLEKLQAKNKTTHT